MKCVGWAKRSVPTNVLPLERWWAGACAPLPTLRTLRNDGKLKTMRRSGSGKIGAIVRTIRIIPLLGLPMNLRKLLSALLLLSLPAMAQAADITGVPKIREGDQLQIGNNRIRLGGIDAPAVDQLCLNTNGERWTCGAAARDELIKRFGGKSWTCHTRAVTDRRGRTVARCEADGEDIQKWLVSNGWALALTRVSRDYEADEKAAREAKAGMWQGAFIAPWDWRVRNKKTAILGAVKPPENAKAILLASASGPSRALARLHHQGQRQPRPANASFTSRRAAGMRRSR